MSAPVHQLNLLAKLFNAAERNRLSNALEASLWLVYCEAYLDGCIMTKSALEAYKEQCPREVLTTAELDGLFAMELVKARSMPFVGTKEL
jgi:hypothetical protein